MGKITQEDISVVMEEFEDLDVDQSGTLSVSDLALAQSSSQARVPTSGQERPIWHYFWIYSRLWFVYISVNIQDHISTVL